MAGAEPNLKLSEASAASVVADLLKGGIAADRLTSSGAGLSRRLATNDTRYSFNESLVIAAALQAGAEVLYCEDLQHNQLIGGSWRVMNPFLAVANDGVT